MTDAFPHLIFNAGDELAYEFFIFGVPLWLFGHHGQRGRVDLVLLPDARGHHRLKRADHHVLWRAHHRISDLFQVLFVLYALHYEPDHPFGLLLVIRPAQWIHKLLHLFGVTERTQAPVTHHQRERLVRILAIKLADDWSSHAVADERDALDARVREHGVNRSREQIHRISDLRLTALAVTGQVNGDHARLINERRNVRLPVLQTARPSVYEHDGLLALAVIPVTHAKRVELGEAILRRRLFRLR